MYVIFSENVLEGVEDEAQVLAADCDNTCSVALLVIEEYTRVYHHKRLDLLVVFTEAA